MCDNVCILPQEILGKIWMLKEYQKLCLSNTKCSLNQEFKKLVEQLDTFSYIQDCIYGPNKYYFPKPDKNIKKLIIDEVILLVKNNPVTNIWYKIDNFEQKGGKRSKSNKPVIASQKDNDIIRIIKNAESFTKHTFTTKDLPLDITMPKPPGDIGYIGIFTNNYYDKSYRGMVAPNLCYLDKSLIEGKNPKVQLVEVAYIENKDNKKYFKVTPTGRGIRNLKNIDKTIAGRGIGTQNTINRINARRNASFQQITEISKDRNLTDIINCCKVEIKDNNNKSRFKFNLKRVTADGNCLFNSMLHYVKKLEKYKNINTVEKLKKKIKSEKKDKEYGDYYDIKKAEQIFGVKINVVIGYKKNNNTVIKFKWNDIRNPYRKNWHLNEKPSDDIFVNDKQWNLILHKPGTCGEPADNTGQLHFDILTYIYNDKILPPNEDSAQNTIYPITENFKFVEPSTLIGGEEYKKLQEEREKQQKEKDEKSLK